MWSHSQGSNYTTATTAIAVGALPFIWSFAVVPSRLSFFISIYQGKCCCAPLDTKFEACFNENNGEVELNFLKQNYKTLFILEHILNLEYIYFFTLHKNLFILEHILHLEYIYFLPCIQIMFKTHKNYMFKTHVTAKVMT